MNPLSELNESQLFDTLRRRIESNLGHFLTYGRIGHIEEMEISRQEFGFSVFVVVVFFDKPFGNEIERETATVFLPDFNGKAYYVD